MNEFNEWDHNNGGYGDNNQYPEETSNHEMSEEDKILQKMIEEEESNNSNSDSVEELEEDEVEKPEEEDSSIEDSLVHVPKNIGNSKEFSEKDIYKVVNLVKMFNSMGEEEISVVNGIFNFAFNTGLVKKAINISSLSDEELHDKISPIKIIVLLKKTADSVSSGDSQESFAMIMNCMTRVEEMDEESKDKMLRFFRNNVLKDAKVNRNKLKAKKTSGVTEIVNEIIELINSNEKVHKQINDYVVITEFVEAALNV